MTKLAISDFSCTIYLSFKSFPPLFFCNSPPAHLLSLHPHFLLVISPLHRLYSLCLSMGAAHCMMCLGWQTGLTYLPKAFIPLLLHSPAVDLLYICMHLYHSNVFGINSSVCLILTFFFSLPSSRMMSRVLTCLHRRGHLWDVTQEHIIYTTHVIYIYCLDIVLPLKKLFFKKKKKRKKLSYDTLILS